LFAGLAAFWFVLQTFVVKENLLTTGPNKILTAVHALNRAIFVFDGGNCLPLAGKFPL